MKNTKQNQTGSYSLVILVVLAILAGYFFFTKGGLMMTDQIKGGSDLTKAASELDNTNTNQIDTGLNQLNTDGSTF